MLKAGKGNAGGTTRGKKYQFFSQAHNQKLLDRNLSLSKGYFMTSGGGNQSGGQNRFV
jgi:hypothetical protein